MLTVSINSVGQTARLVKQEKQETKNCSITMCFLFPIRKHSHYERVYRGFYKEEVGND